MAEPARLSRHGDQRDDLSAILERLDVLTAAVNGMRADMRLFGVVHASADETRLVEAIHAECYGRAFLAADLSIAALRKPGSQLEPFLKGKSNKKIGCLLRNSANKRTTDGLVLRKVGGSESLVIWCITIERV